jgi:hypothetical protein
MTIPLFHVDAFTDQPFSGNPAAVCLLPDWREDRWHQAVAAEMNLSETAFLVRNADGFDLRWFTPKLEVDLLRPCNPGPFGAKMLKAQRQKASRSLAHPLANVIFFGNLIDAPLGIDADPDQGDGVQRGLRQPHHRRLRRKVQRRV